jgi:hypothetical protein
MRPDYQHAGGIVAFRPHCLHKLKTQLDVPAVPAASVPLRELDMRHHVDLKSLLEQSRALREQAREIRRRLQEIARAGWPKLAGDRQGGNPPMGIRATASPRIGAALDSPPLTI